MGWPHRQGKAARESGKVAPTHFQQDTARSQPRTCPTGGGRECRHRIPGKAAGPTSGSPSLPPSAPPPPAGTKPARRRGSGLLGGRPDKTGPRPGAPRLRPRWPPSPGESGVSVPDGADASPGWPFEAREAGPPPFQARVPPPTHPGEAWRTRAVPLATPEVAASNAGRLGQPGRGGRPVGGDSLSCRRPFAPHQGADSGLQPTP